MAKKQQARGGWVSRWMRRLRWLHRMALLASVAAGAVKAFQRRPGASGSGGGRGSGGPGGSGRPAPVGGPSPRTRAAEADRPEPEREPVGAAGASTARPRSLTAVRPVADAQDSVEPSADGACPATHPIKANDSSHIYHVPGGRSYDRTTPTRCYATPEAAEAEGYRPAKR